MGAAIRSRSCSSVWQHWSIPSDASGGGKTAQLKAMLALVDDAERVLTDKNADLDDFGRMLDHTWKLKRQTGSAVSTNSMTVISVLAQDERFNTTGNIDEAFRTEDGELDLERLLGHKLGENG